ncbi:hypothetical protein [Caudoviricetes sp.]|nr:hypothetical protein [Caudoviricetes sp.]UOF82759.1 hypothetical protein [Caudoviricetes sp.]
MKLEFNGNSLEIIHNANDKDGTYRVNAILTTKDDEIVGLLKTRTFCVTLPQAQVAFLEATRVALSDESDTWVKDVYDLIESFERSGHEPLVYAMACHPYDSGVAYYRGTVYDTEDGETVLVHGDGSDVVVPNAGWIDDVKAILAGSLAKKVLS